MSDWTFKQLGGAVPKTMILTGYAAPFGRPRQKPVVMVGRYLRKKQTHYPGNSGAPTTHLFGGASEPMELSGRWMDKFLGKGSAERNYRVFQDMVDDQIPVRITWGDLLSYIGWIDKINVHWESESQCSWSLQLLIDVDEFKGRKPNIGPVRPPADVADDVNQWLTAVITPLPSTLPSLDAVAGEVFDAIDDLVTNVTQYGGAAVKLANSISNVETAGFNELERLRAGLHQFKTAVITLQDTVDSLAVDTLIIDRALEDDIAWLTFQSKSTAHTNDMIFSITQLEAQAEQAVMLRIKTTYQAKPGDSWESISNDVYGEPSRAGDIRQANGIKGGAPPVSGVTYNIPA